MLTDRGLALLCHPEHLAHRVDTKGLTRWGYVGIGSTMDPRARLSAFLAWRGWKHPHLAVACRCSAPMISHILTGRKNPGVEIVHAIERVTGEPNDDGAVWEPGPIHTEEWLKSDTSDDVANAEG